MQSSLKYYLLTYRHDGEIGEAMKTYGLVALMEKGIHFGSDDVCIKECSFKVGKHRHQRARRHKRIYNKMERARAKALIYNEMKNMEE